MPITRCDRCKKSVAGAEDNTRIDVIHEGNLGESGPTGPFLYYDLCADCTRGLAAFLSNKVMEPA